MNTADNQHTRSESASAVNSDLDYIEQRRAQKAPQVGQRVRIIENNVFICEGIYRGPDDTDPDLLIVECEYPVGTERIFTKSPVTGKPLNLKVEVVA